MPCRARTSAAHTRIVVPTDPAANAPGVNARS
jgi:hypothetical protein